jgi:hypothetical protein
VIERAAIQPDPAAPVHLAPVNLAPVHLAPIHRAPINLWAIGRAMDTLTAPR